MHRDIVDNISSLFCNCLSLYVHLSDKPVLFYIDSSANRIKLNVSSATDAYVIHSSCNRQYTVTYVLTLYTLSLTYSHINPLTFYTKHDWITVRRGRAKHVKRNVLHHNDVTTLWTYSDKDGVCITTPVCCLIVCSQLCVFVFSYLKASVGAVCCKASYIRHTIRVCVSYHSFALFFSCFQYLLNCLIIISWSLANEQVLTSSDTAALAGN